MRKKLALAAVTAALAVSPFAAAPAQASAGPLCALFAEPFDVVVCAAEDRICSRPWPPLCR